MDIVNMTGFTDEQLNQAAQVLTDSLPEGWPDFDSAMEEIRELLAPENTLLAAVEGGQVIGFGGILPEYRGRVRELHPLAVRKDMRGQGVGARLMRALEDEARKAGAHTMVIGADDEREGGETSLANVDLYDDLPGKLAAFDPGRHQSAFYMKMGYVVTGVTPDANGPGKPDIFLGKRLR